MSRLILRATTTNPSRSSSSLPRASSLVQTRQATVASLRVEVQTADQSTLVVVTCPLRGPDTAPCQITETEDTEQIEVEIEVPQGLGRLAVVTLFDQGGREIFRGEKTINVTQSVQNEDIVLVRLVPANSPPQVNAGPSQTVGFGTTVHLDGSRSSNIDGDPLSFSWTIASRPLGSQATLSDATAVKPTFVVDRPGAYVVQLIVHDDQLPSAPATVTISTINTPPIANAGPDRSVDERTTVTLDGRGSSDPNGDPFPRLWWISPGSTWCSSSSTTARSTVRRPPRQSPHRFRGSPSHSLGANAVSVGATATLGVTLNAPAPAGGMTVTVSSDAPGILAPTPPGAVFIAAGNTVGQVTVQGVTPGITTVRANAPGFTEGTRDVQVDPNLLAIPGAVAVEVGGTGTLRVTLGQQTSSTVYPQGHSVLQMQPKICEIFLGARASGPLRKRARRPCSQEYTAAITEN